MAQTIVTGRSSHFEVYVIKGEEEKTIKLQPNSEKTYKFGLVTHHSEHKKEYKSDIYDVGLPEQETWITFEKTQRGFQVTKSDTEASQDILRPAYRVAFKESERNTAENWELWMDSLLQLKTEGPVLLSDHRVTGGHTVNELKQQLRILLEKGIIRWLKF